MPKKTKITPDKDRNKLPGYPLYPENEDIYNREKEETDLDPEDLSKNKTPNEEVSNLNEKNFRDDVSGGDLDIPGVDEGTKNPANEDEENNYFSLGDDDTEFTEDRED